MKENQKIDLKPQHHKILSDLLDRYLPDTAVWAYGSRVKFTATPRSDLDLVALSVPAQRAALSDLREALERSNLPFRVDLFEWSELPEPFRRNIESNKVILQIGKMPNQSGETEGYSAGLGYLSELRELLAQKIELNNQMNRTLKRISDAQKGSPNHQMSQLNLAKRIQVNLKQNRTLIKLGRALEVMPTLSV